MALIADIPVPALLQKGIQMTKVTAHAQKSYLFKLDADQGQIIWESKRLRIIPIENIMELRSGSEARYYREHFHIAREQESLWITIIYTLEERYKTLHLIASSLIAFQLWDITLRKLYAVRRELMTGLGHEEMREALWVKQCWKSTGEERDHTLSFEQVEAFCKRLNMGWSVDELAQLFKTADSQHRQYLDFTDFQTFVKLLKARPEINQLYKELCSTNDGKFTYSIFEGFMRDTQKTNLTQQELENLFMRYSVKMSDSKIAASAPDLSSLMMSSDSFATFLRSSDNSAFTGQNAKVHQPMTYPLSSYFISTSHNTYLVGNQLVGHSTIEGYIRALLHGCRSVELDIYDGEHEPMVFHGGTFTSKLSVREICEAIRKYAFVSSPYPIILSAELHVSVPQQEVLANILREVFGETLVTAPIEGKPLSGALPSPEDLKGRVLLKAKNLYVSSKEPIREQELTIDPESSSESETKSDTKNDKTEEHKKAKMQGTTVVKAMKEELRRVRKVFHRVHNRSPSSKRSAPVVETSATTTTSTAATEQSSESDVKPKQKTKMSPDLVALLIYTVGVKCRGINKDEHYAPVHLLSLSETRMNKILREGAADLIRHNKTHLVRTYPKGIRVRSTNYLPHRFWATGVHLTAINWQTCDLGYIINHAMFQRNGRSGYVLKPEVLRKTEDPHKEHLHHHTRHYLEVTVISAQQLPHPKNTTGHEVTERHFDTYVEVSVHTPDWGHPNGTSQSSGSPSASRVHDHHTAATIRTSVVKNNGFNPIWQEAFKLPFECVGDMRDLVFVRFSVQRDGDLEGEPIALYCISLESLGMGYRHLPLHDSQASQYLFSTLFVRCLVHDA